MNRRLLVAALAIFSATHLAAQDGPRPRGGNRLDFLAGYLNLTDAQKQQANTIFTAANTAATTAAGQMTAARDALKNAIKANAADAELDRLSAAVGAVEGQVTAIRAKASAKFYALLTAEQKAKYDQLGDRGPGGGRSSRRGGF